MPSIAHAIIGLMLCAILSKFSQGKLNYRHAIIFSINCCFGPDIFNLMPYEDPWMPLYLFLHGLGWVVAAFPIAWIWFFVVDRKLDWNEKQKQQNQLLFAHSAALLS